VKRDFRQPHQEHCDAASSTAMRTPPANSPCGLCLAGARHSHRRFLRFVPSYVL